MVQQGEYTAAQPKQNLSEIWAELQENINQVFQQEKSLTPVRYMQLYTLVYNYCNVNDRTYPKLACEALYECLKDFLTKYLSEVLKKLISIKDDEFLVARYAKEWENYQFSSTVLNGICVYLNRYWVKREYEEGRKRIYEIFRLAMVIWRENVFKVMYEPVTRAILKFIEDDRNGFAVNRSAIRSILDCFVQLGFNEEDVGQSDKSGEEQLIVYRALFEKSFLEETVAYYEQASKDVLSRRTVNEYMRFVENCLNEESKRINQADINYEDIAYLHGSTYHILMRTCEHVLVENQLELFSNEFKFLLNFGKNEELKLMYSLVSRTPNVLNHLKAQLEEHILQQGSAGIERAVVDSYLSST